MAQSLNWNETAERAQKMSRNELWSARLDCIKAGEAAWELEKAGHSPIAKDQGYYLDEASVYAQEMRRREGR